MDSIFLGPALVGDYEDKWSFDISSITKDNFLDFPITLEDLKNLETWNKTNHSDLRTIMTSRPDARDVVFDPESERAIPLHPSNEELEAIRDAVEDAAAEMKNQENDLTTIHNGVKAIYRYDRGLIHPLSELIANLGELSHDFYSQPDLVRAAILNSNSHEPLSIMALANLQNYLLSGGENEDTLYMCMTNIIMELHRRQYRATINKAQDNNENE
jgi:hypothetical protein